MEILKDPVLLFFFFIPGFISLKIYDMIIPSDRRDFSASIHEVIAYSVINFSFFSWVIYLISHFEINQHHPLWYGFSLFIILFAFPVAWPFILFKIRTCESISRFIMHPIKKPWDWVFRKQGDYWVIVTLSDDRKIGGKYDAKSYTSSYPADEQIFLEEVWKLDSNGVFLEAIQGSNGILILKDILTIEFLLSE